MYRYSIAASALLTEGPFLRSRSMYRYSIAASALLTEGHSSVPAASLAAPYGLIYIYIYINIYIQHNHKCN